MKKIAYIILLLNIAFLISCKSTLPIEYQLANDILEEQVDKNTKTFFTYYCGYDVSFKRLYFITHYINYRRGYLDKKHKNKPYTKEKYCWIFNDDDINFLKEKIDSVPNSCWDTTKIKNKELIYMSKKEKDVKYTYEKMKKYILKELERPIKDGDQVVYLSKPFINKTKDKAIFLFNNSKTAKENTQKIAIAQKIKEKWTIIGYVYDGIY